MGSRVKVNLTNDQILIAKETFHVEVEETKLSTIKKDDEANFY
jgi:hypothetical protein